MVDSFLKLKHVNFLELAKTNDTAQIDELVIIFVQHSGVLPIKQVIEIPGSDRSKVNTVHVLNMDSFKAFKKKFAKANIADSYWEDASNSSFMKYANAYVAQLIALYQLALVEYVKTNKDTLDEIQAKMKDTVLRNAIVWSNTSP